MGFNKNELFTLWLQNKPTNLNYQCWLSWIRYGYRPILYYDDLDNLNEMPSILKSQFSLISLDTLPSFYKIDTDNLLQKTDILRFIILNTYGGTWIDSDMFLLKRLNDDNIIISSERTLQSGGRKSLETYRPNIGLLRFPPNNGFVAQVLLKLLPKTKGDIHDSSNNTSKMMKFIKLLKLKKWKFMNNYVAPPHHYCPIDYPFAKEIFTKDIDNPLIVKKYGLEYSTDLSDSYAVHLWENMVLNRHKIDVNGNGNGNGIHKNSLWINLINKNKN